MALSELISLLRQGTVQGSKSTVMTQLNWVIGILVAGILGAKSAGLPERMVDTLIACLVLFLVGYMCAFAYFAKTNPDALRTETYILKKLAIEHHLRGDDLAGITEVIDITERPALKKGVALPTPDVKSKKLRAAKRDVTSEGQAP